MHKSRDDLPANLAEHEVGATVEKIYATCLRVENDAREGCVQFCYPCKVSASAECLSFVDIRAEINRIRRHNVALKRERLDTMAYSNISVGI